MSVVGFTHRDSNRLPSPPRVRFSQRTLYWRPFGRVVTAVSSLFFSRNALPSLGARSRGARRKQLESAREFQNPTVHRYRSDTQSTRHHRTHLPQRVVPTLRWWQDRSRVCLELVRWANLPQRRALCAGRCATDTVFLSATTQTVASTARASRQKTVERIEGGGGRGERGGKSNCARPCHSELPMN